MGFSSSATPSDTRCYMLVCYLRFQCFHSYRLLSIAALQGYPDCVRTLIKVSPGFNIILLFILYTCFAIQKHAPVNAASYQTMWYALQPSPANNQNLQILIILINIQQKDSVAPGREAQPRGMRRGAAASRSLSAASRFRGQAAERLRQRSGRQRVRHQSQRAAPGVRKPSCLERRNKVNRHGRSGNSIFRLFSYRIVSR
jgi:hypothetical protein